MKRKLQDLLPLLNEARNLWGKAVWDSEFDDMIIYKDNKYYLVSNIDEIPMAEDDVKKMWELIFHIKFDDMIK